MCIRAALSARRVDVTARAKDTRRRQNCSVMRYVYACCTRAARARPTALGPAYQIGHCQSSLLQCSKMDSSLPLRCLNSDTLTGLTNALTVENALKHDWRHLADHVGFSFTHIALMRQHGRSDKAMLLLEVWERTGESSLPKLIVALMQTNLRSSLDVLTNARELRDRTCIKQGAGTC